ncbi:putative isopentenyl-diphosphate delta-isomerase (plasmid) [Aromatoleum aromaticum EbN1]|uniref:Isopentenyl-diphosphate Delta-isomerase 2 n=1 Tax=Aromatoleum aromaticum (strain DSM 19018 / LMG 30748 / EbN1) TaxID=76114 RepID=IDI2_AROAE|nr:isopentenyl-diphosphate Delta-isomerase [Aromatoleum aromaticum]Q5NWG5.1 RecName: Full=Isopentenyl-diphosphate Delta-isomerase 2; Short=IPP isomerase 2; AltName: Full=IPP:DMAPP isomerase 2; AltName: Full=Isopentenyl pyrophosphate isomerase 2 [Aromatoleum aromaticum EbN1]CAI10599.1 putative isopentenyl-diphosphate delta-isomerase [Aromatoleum aromaticum EbN1]
MEDQVILVDEHDNKVGFAGKMAAHQRGALHRAISIFVFDSHSRLMLQRRAAGKYHSGGLWSNTCCSHPRPNEESADAARRRLREEMGVDCELKKAFSFVYRTKFGSGLIEHEFDHVFFGNHDGRPVLNPDEADDWKWVDLTELTVDVRKRPETYSFWLAACLDRVISCRSLNGAGAAAQKIGSTITLMA